METLTQKNISPIHFTESAYKELLRLIEANDTKNKILRIGAKGGGCSGLTYVLEFDQKNEEDKIFSFNEIEFVVHPSHLLYLKGMTIEYESGLNARGFMFQNPNASNTCGCGTSFAV